MYGYIYITTNLINGKQYIGQKKSSEFLGNKYLGSGKILKCAIAKYGESNFSTELICECKSKQELDEKEEHYIEKYNAQKDEHFYNIRRGGDRGPGGPMFQGHKHTKETKERMSKQRKGKNNANYGNHWHQSDELKHKHSLLSSGENNGMYGKKQKDSTKQLISQQNSGRKYINKDGVRKRVKETDLDMYLNQGWKLGYKL